MAPESKSHDTPEYFIMMMEPGVGARMSVLRGERDAHVDLTWHVRDSIRDVVDSPLRLLSNYREGEELPDVFGNGERIIVSTRVRDSVEGWLRDYEFLPVEIEHCRTDQYNDIGGGSLVRGYWWLNSWRRLNVIDWSCSDLVPAVLPLSPSKYAQAPLKVNHWRRLVVRPEVLRGEHFFGVKFVRGAKRYLSPELHGHLLAQRFRLRFGAEWLGPPKESTWEVNRRLNEPGDEGGRM